MKRNSFINSVLFIVALMFCSCHIDEQQIPVAEEFVYTMSLDVALSDYDTPVTRSGYDWPDGAKLYLRFANVSRSVAGYARYSKSEDSWSVATSEALFNIDSARCEAYYFKDFTVSDAVIVPLSESSVVYQDTCGSYVKADNDLAVKLSLSPKTGRIRFKGEPGRKFTVRGLYRLSGYDILENRFDSTKVELLPTVTDDGYTPYYYVFFSDTSRTLNVVDDFLWYERNCPSVVLASGKSGYMDVPTEATHNGWIMLDKTLLVAESVDLGLSVKWASWNVGATAPEEYGGYYAWGETTTKNDYSWETYKWCEISDTSMTKYSTVGNNISLEFEDDVARVKWGERWRMPTEKEIGELCDNCTWQWITVNGVNGHLVTGPNGNFIFLPAAGLCDGTDFIYQGSIGYYWSSMLGYNHTAGNTLAFRSDYKAFSLCWSRFYGFTVRPVMEKAPEKVTIDFDIPEISDIVSHSAVVKGLIKVYGAELTEVGVVYGTVSMPTVNDNKIIATDADIKCTLNDLLDNTRYYVRLYAVVNEQTFYGEETEFITKEELIVSFLPTDYYENRLVLKAKVPEEYSSIQVCYDTQSSPKITDNIATATMNKNGDLVLDLSGLTKGTTYYIRPYSRNGTNIEYYEEEVAVETIGKTYHFATGKVLMQATLSESTYRYYDCHMYIPINCSLPDGTYIVSTKEGHCRGFKNSLTGGYQDYTYISGGSCVVYMKVQAYDVNSVDLGTYNAIDVEFESIDTNVVYHYIIPQFKLNYDGNYNNRGSY